MTEIPELTTEAKEYLESLTHTNKFYLEIEEQCSELSKIESIALRMSITDSIIWQGLYNGSPMKSVLEKFADHYPEVKKQMELRERIYREQMGEAA